MNIAREMERSDPAQNSKVILLCERSCARSRTQSLVIQSVHIPHAHLKLVLESKKVSCALRLHHKITFQRQQGEKGREGDRHSKKGNQQSRGGEYHGENQHVKDKS